MNDAERRQWILAVSVTGGAGFAAASVPFVASLEPGERARALGASVQVDVRSIRPGELATVEWRGKPVWVLRRMAQMVAALQSHDDQLADPRSALRGQRPDYARNAIRSIRPDVAVLAAICTHLGCYPTFRPEPGAADIGADWSGGFFYTCHVSRFDLAGRVFRNVPVPSNLEMSPHHYRADDLLVIGAGPPARRPILSAAGTGAAAPALSSLPTLLAASARYACVASWNLRGGHRNETPCRSRVP